MKSGSGGLWMVITNPDALSVDIPAPSRIPVHNYVIATHLVLMRVRKHGFTSCLTI